MDQKIVDAFNVVSAAASKANLQAQEHDLVRAHLRTLAAQLEKLDQATQELKDSNKDPVQTEVIK